MQSARRASRPSSTQRLRRPPRHGRTRLRRAAEPALRLVRHPHVPVRPAHRTATPPRPIEPRPLEHPRLHDSTRPARTSRSTGGYGNVFGPTLQQPVHARVLRRFLHRLRRATTRSRSAATTRTTRPSARRYFTGGRAHAHPPLPAAGANICDLSLAPFYTNAGRRPTTQVFYQHDLLRRRHAGRLRDHPDPRRSTHRPSATAPSSRTSGGSSRR